MCFRPDWSNRSLAFPSLFLTQWINWGRYEKQWFSDISWRQCRMVIPERGEANEMSPIIAPVIFLEWISRLQYCERKLGKAQKNPGVGKTELGVQGCHGGWCAQGKISERKQLLGGTESTVDLKKVPLRPFAEYIQHMSVTKLPKVGEWMNHSKKEQTEISSELT